MFEAPPVHELSSYFILLLFFPVSEQINDVYLNRKERRQKSTGCGRASGIITHCVLYFTEERGSTHVSFRYCFFFITIKIFIIFRLSGSVLSLQCTCHTST
jgi:hypothetical protein